jgi:regulator of RNase E activity RraA
MGLRAVRQGEGHVRAEEILRLSRLGTAAVADALDLLGLRAQCLSAAIVPIAVHPIAEMPPVGAISEQPAGALPLVGRALTLRAVAVSAHPAQPHAGELAAVDSLNRGDVVVAEARAVECAFWGELLSTAALTRGAHGVVVDGWVRDIAQMRALPFPVFARGGSPYDSSGRLEIAASNEPIVCGGVLVHPGDAVLGDVDGVAVIPAERIEEVLRLAEKKRQREDSVRPLYASARSASEVYRDNGVL